MTGLMEEFVSSVARKNVEKEEELIRSVLPKGISDLEIVKRCKWISNVNRPGVRTLYFDEEPVLTLHEPEVEQVEKDGSVFLRTTQIYAKH